MSSSRTTEKIDRIDTRLGALRVRIIGSGPMTVLWPSMFIDSSTWDPLIPLLDRNRQYVLVDGPGLGLSDPLLRRSNITEAADAALDLLRGLGATGPVDWVGNAFGGHVGYKLGAMPGVLRSFVAISAPVEPISAALRAQINVLLPLLRLAGPVGPVRDAIMSAMVTEASAKNESIRRVVIESIERPSRRSMTNALRSFILDRLDVTAELANIDVPVPVHRVGRSRGLEPRGGNAGCGAHSERHRRDRRARPHAHPPRTASRGRRAPPQFLGISLMYRHHRVTGAVLTVGAIAALTGCVPSPEAMYSAAARQAIAELADLGPEAREQAVLERASAAEADIWKQSGLDDALGGADATSELLRTALTPTLDWVASERAQPSTMVLASSAWSPRLPRARWASASSQWMLSLMPRSARPMTVRLAPKRVRCQMAASASRSVKTAACRPSIQAPTPSTMQT